MTQKIAPARSAAKAKSASIMVADLDAMLVKTVSFQFKGVVYEIPPLSVEAFMTLVSKYTELMALQSEEKVSGDQLLDSYYEMIHSACKEITKELVSEMTQQQISGLFQIIVDLVSGRLFADQKKTLENVRALMTPLIIPK